MDAGSQPFRCVPKLGMSHRRENRLHSILILGLTHCQEEFDNGSKNPSKMVHVARVLDVASEGALK